MAIEEQGAKEALPKPPTKTEQMFLSAMSDLEPQHPPTATVIYGNVGTGKTITGMEFLWEVVPADQRILYVHSANGHTSFNNHPKYFGKLANGKRRVKVLAYENQEQLIALAGILKAAQKNPDSVFHQFGGVILDELTSMSIRDAKWILAQRVKQAEARKEFKDPYVASIVEHGAVYSRTSAVVEAFTLLNIHLMFICHERIHDKTGQIVPDFGDKTAKAVYKDMHSVFFADVKDRKEGQQYVNTLHFQPTKRYMAKNRIGGMGASGTVQEVIDAYKKWGIDESGESMKPIKKEEVANSEPLPVVTAKTESELIDELPELD